MTEGIARRTEAVGSQENATAPDVVARIEADIAPSLNYASWQNSVPLVRSLEVMNPSGELLSGLELRLTSSPPFARAKVWRIEQLAPGQSLALRDRDVEFDADYLAGLNEAERGALRFTLHQRDTLLAEKTYPARVLARDEWGGMPSAELLAAHVMPNDPAIAKLLKSASEVLARHGHPTGLDGYQSGDPRRAYLLCAAVWSAVAGEGITYAAPPTSFEQTGQKTRRPSIILGDRLATCLDTTLLFAAAIEAIGLNAVAVMQQGHCFVGAWIVEKSLARLIGTDPTEVRKAIAAKELIVWETTLVTSRPPARFQDAINQAVESLRDSHDGQFVAAIDIARARMAQIRPLASHDASAGAAPDSAATDPLPLPQAPVFGTLPEEQSDEQPTTAEGRILRWQRKLLDLSLRNKLLNFRATKQTVPVVCPDLAHLENRLAEGAKLRLVSLAGENPIGERDRDLHQQRTGKDLDIEFARQALARDEVPCAVADVELTNRLTTLYRAVRNDLAEGGSNTLFLAVGFLKWKPRDDASKTYRAPLLLIPVTLTRRSAASPYNLQHHEDDVRFNATLIQLLKKDFDCDISAMESNLPKDESGVDVPLVLERMRRAVRDIAGFEVVDECALGTFSFAKYLMWKDLVERLDDLKNNRVVCHLIEEPDKPFDSGAGGGIPDAKEIDKRFEPQSILHPLPADSSQLAAVMAASEGQDFVLIGPPGTGKSQTIANLIAQCLGTGKTVLFVAEKTAALDVVYRRLREHGLGDCCLELHSNRADRRHFLDQLDAAWQNNRRHIENDWISINGRLKVRRDELNSYAEAIHERHSNGWTVFDAMGCVVRGAGREVSRFDWPANTPHDTATTQKFEELARRASATFKVLDPTARLSQVAATQWSAAWESQLLASCEELRLAAARFLEAFAGFTSAIGLQDKRDGSWAECESLCQLAHAIESCAGEQAKVIFHKEFAKFPAAAAQLQQAIVLCGEALEKSAGVYPDDQLDKIPLDDLDQRWRLASASFWPMSWLGKRKVTKLLQSYAAGGKANPTTDLPAIQARREQLAAISASPLAGHVPYFQGLATDVAALTSYLERTSQLRKSLLAVGQPLQRTNDMARAVFAQWTGSQRDLPVFAAARDYLQGWEEFRAAVAQYAQLAKANPIGSQHPAAIEGARDSATHVIALRSHLQRWTAWREIEHECASLGLQPLLDRLQAASVSPDDLLAHFRLSYAHWWLPGAIDRSQVLRTFQRFKHEEAIKDFCTLDDEARKLAASRVRDVLAHGLPAQDKVPRKSELGLLRHQINLKRPSKSIRQVIGELPESFGKLAPCLLMSPLSIAQYLPPNQAIFDVVVFDEASQITTWDAIGAISRGRQTIIVGDPKQLPPTNFFGRVEDDQENDEIEEHEKDLESILDEASVSGLPTLQLNWHYRSRHESLIAFSNFNYYGNNLVTFPAAESEDRGVVFRHLPDAIYDRGKSRSNRKGAEAIVEDVVSRMRAELSRPERERLTFGVITFNIQQQTLIQDLLDAARRDDPELEWFFSDDRIEPTAVKNLENVQGDERDVMYFSITFGRDVSGKPISLNFGALNRDGGERRLNVAVTRARQQLIVYSSFKGEELAAERSGKRGVMHLKHFLEYAEKGPNALAAQTEGSVGGFDSPFEEAVAQSLMARGWQVVPQVGVSGFRVDLGIVHPHKPGAYLAGVECDGATYHRSAIARDRDKTRQLVLENLGWHIIRVWSPDWWYDGPSAIKRLHAELEGLAKLPPADTAG